MYDSFYEGIITLIFKKGDEYDINNWRQLTLMNLDYKIFAKVLVNRMQDSLDLLIEREQTCAVKGRLMFDNLCMLRECISNVEKEDGFYIIALDQKKDFDYVSREYLFEVLKKYGFPKNFIKMIRCLYAKSLVQVNVNGQLTECFEVHRGVKQGCPLSAALYVISISPLVKIIQNDKRLEGVKVGNERVIISAYADDITVFVKSQTELDIIYEHFKIYEKISRAVLNHHKSEAVWIGNLSKQFPIHINVKEEIKVLGIYISNTDCCESNWQKKEKEVKDEVLKWSGRNTSFRSRIGICNLLILSKIMFLSSVFPPTEKYITKISKECCKLIWGTNREVTRRELLFKPRK